jgi:hypothetical protein
LIASATCHAQNLDLVEGFYKIMEHENENSRKMLLQGDSSRVYNIAEQPVVSKYDRLSSEVGQDSVSLYFFYNEQGTRKLLEFTSNHPRGELGFVWLGSLIKIYTIEEIVDNGVIEFTSDRIYKVSRKIPDMEK